MLGDAFKPNAPTDRIAPAHGIAPDLPASSGLNTLSSFANDLSSRSAAEGSASVLRMADRSYVHTSDAMKGLYDTADAPSYSTRGALMVRNDFCYRCMKCSGTGGCS